ncbi:unnamed protein product, partial [Durusdinium trenchii]
GVVFGNGLLPLFSGSHLLSTGYFYAFKASLAGSWMGESEEDQSRQVTVQKHSWTLALCLNTLNWLEGLRDLSLAFGVTFLPGGH